MGMVIRTILIALLLLPGIAQGASYYLRADGTVAAANKAQATSCTSASTALSPATHDAATFAPGDTIYLCDSGGEYRRALNASSALLTPPSSGTDGLPITYTAAPGHHPVLNGARIVTGWSNVSSGLWRVAISTDTGPDRQVFFDGMYGQKKSSSAACTSNRDFFKDATNHYLYVYVDSDPSTIQIESTTQAWGICTQGASYISIVGPMTIRYPMFGVYTGLNKTGPHIIIDGLVIHDISCGIVVDGGAAPIIRNNVVYNSHFPGEGEDGGGINISVFDAPGYLIHNNDVHDCEGYGIGIASAVVSPGTISNNIVYRCGTNAAALERYGIAVHDNATVKNNEVSYCGSSANDYALFVYGLSTAASNSYIYRNIVHHNVDVGVRVQGVAYVDMAYNVVYLNGRDGVDLRSNGAAAARSQCVNNTFAYNCQTGGLANLNLYNIDYCDVKNNIITDAGPGATYVVYCGSSVASQDFDYNLYGEYTGVFGWYKGGEKSGLSDWKLVGIPLNDRNSPAAADPKFISANDYRLDKVSPGIGVGSDLGASYKYDILSNPQDFVFGTWDLGAYVYRPGLPTRFGGLP